jgi:hypothetical protein
MSRKTSSPLNKLWALALVALALLPGTRPSVAAPDDAPHAVGTWQGVLEAGTQRLRLVVRIRRDASGALTDTLDSIDQGARGLPLDAITLVEDVLSFQLIQLGGRYAGNFYGNDTIRGIWSQGQNSLPLILRRDGDGPH